ncbi:probable aspartyl protease At4g16563 [Cynara cardunculus var. scolymus]|uniref:Aspartic peptidase n=1 Tax=Cynara cardunculus var. scolymus TaxID=59895 RepID=A0A103YFV3_CYNCS|nr:probable aspartyl protease At4g16563 [Cynara cardunculus var. scolymus]KVI08337.1 Aspartic peptidase [Cynara cardunculus var. scolymus]
MASSSLYLLFILSLLSSHSSSSQTTLTLSPTPISIAPSPQSNHHHPWLQTLNYLASSSLARAHHLKHPKDNSSQIPLFPQSYGGYSVSLSFGSPPQKLSFVMDTGSSLVWFPCTHRYQCSDCQFSNVNPNNISRFIPKLSSSSKIIGCSNKKCGWVFGSSNPIQCNGKEICPAYMLQYGSGSTAGLMLSETLDFPEGDVTDFAVGCSILSTRQPSGIAGFGRGPASLPVQMGLKRFSYCLVSHRFDDAPVSSELVLVRDSSNSGGSDAGISYTKFHKNPVSSRSSFQDYYYVNLRKITVGGKTVKIPYGFLVPGSDGNGGTIIDSGTTFTFMDNHVYDLVAKEFENQMSKYKRSGEMESKSGLRPCFDIGDKPVKIPALMFHFKGGAKLSLPLADYFSFMGESDVVCMTIVSSESIGSDTRIGPSIILGNYQQQNIYLEYDLEKGRLGFKNQICK